MKTCLIVDDSSVIRKVAKRIIEDMNFRVLEADDGPDALSSCEQQMPDAMIVDWKMPSSTGVDLIRAFHAKFGEAAENTKIMFCTSEMDVPIMSQARRAGAQGFLLKPFDRRGLISKFTELGLSDANA